MPHKQMHRREVEEGTQHSLPELQAPMKLEDLDKPIRLQKQVLKL